MLLRALTEIDKNHTTQEHQEKILQHKQAQKLFRLNIERPIEQEVLKLRPLKCDIQAWFTLIAHPLAQNGVHASYNHLMRVQIHPD